MNAPTGLSSASTRPDEQQETSLFPAPSGDSLGEAAGPKGHLLVPDGLDAKSALGLDLTTNLCRPCPQEPGNAAPFLSPPDLGA